MIDGDLLRKLGYYGDEVFDNTDLQRKAADENIPYYYIPLPEEIEKRVSIKEEEEREKARAKEKELELGKKPVEIIPRFGDFSKDGTLVIDFEPPEANVPPQWTLLWDETS